MPTASPCREVRPLRKGAARWPWVESRRVVGQDPGGWVQVGVRVIGTLVRSHCTTHHFGPYLDLRREIGSGPFRSIGWSCQALKHTGFVFSMFIIQFCLSYLVYCVCFKRRWLRVNRFWITCPFICVNVHASCLWLGYIYCTIDIYLRLLQWWVSQVCSPGVAGANGLPPQYIPVLGSGVGGEHTWWNYFISHGYTKILQALVLW